MKVFSIIYVCLYLSLSSTCYSQKNYTIELYRTEKNNIDSIDNFLVQENYLLAKKFLNRCSSPYDGNMYLRKARINYGLGKNSDRLVKQALNSNLYIDTNFIDTSIKFYAHYKELLCKDQKAIETTLENQELIDLCNRIIKKDQELREQGIETGSIQDKDNLQKLDSIIEAYGWPSSYLLTRPGSGIEIILAHQNFSSALEFDYYYKLVADLCLKKKESWQVVEFIVQQRSQWFGSTLRQGGDEEIWDTLSIEMKRNTLEDKFTIPYFAAFSKKMCTNGHYKVVFEVNNNQLASLITKALYDFEYKITMPAEHIEYFKNNGFSYPGEISDERIEIKLNPAIDENTVVYSFVR